MPARAQHLDNPQRAAGGQARTVAIDDDGGPGIPRHRRERQLEHGAPVEVFDRHDLEHALRRLQNP